jgi:hypothetical protein
MKYVAYVRIEVPFSFGPESFDGELLKSQVTSEEVTAYSMRRVHRSLIFWHLVDTFIWGSFFELIGTPRC